MEYTPIRVSDIIRQVDQDKLAFALILFIVLSSPSCLGQLILPKPGDPLSSFDVASVRPNNSCATKCDFVPPDIAGDRYSVRNIPLSNIVQNAFGAKSSAEIAGLPKWVINTNFDIDARESAEQMTQLNALPADQQYRELMFMLQALLVERFNLKFHVETRQRSAYDLTVSKSGSKLVSSISAESSQATATAMYARKIAGGYQLTASGVSMDVFTQYLSGYSDGIVVNKTRLPGKYDINLRWISDQDQLTAGTSSNGIPEQAAQNDPPVLSVALAEQLGLKLEKRKEDVQTIVVDHIDQLSKN